MDNNTNIKDFISAKLTKINDEFNEHDIPHIAVAVTDDDLCCSVIDVYNIDLFCHMWGIVALRLAKNVPDKDCQKLVDRLHQLLDRINKIRSNRNE